MTDKKEEEKLEVGGIMKMSTLKKIAKVVFVAAVGFFIGRKTA